jgi:hypothetical protein
MKRWERKYEQSDQWSQPEKAPRLIIIIIIIVIIISIVQNSIFHDSETTWSTQFQCPQPASCLGGVRFRSRLISYAALIDLPRNERSAQATRLLRTFCSKWASLTRIPRSSCTFLCFQRTHAKDRNTIASTHARSDNTKSWRRTSFSRLFTMAQVSWSKRWIRPEASYCSPFSSDFFWFMFFLRSFFPTLPGRGGVFVWFFPSAVQHRSRCCRKRISSGFHSPLCICSKRAFWQ